MEPAKKDFLLPPPSIATVANETSSPEAFSSAPSVVGVPSQRLSTTESNSKKATAHTPDQSLDPQATLFRWTLAIAKDALTYPWRKDGWAIIFPGAVMAILLGVGSLAPIIGLFALIFAIGYFAAYYLRIIETTISGKDAPPDWPETSNLSEDVFRPGFQIVGTHIISFLPLFLYKLSSAAKPDTDLVTPVLILLASVYQPMACIALVMHGSIVAAFPHKVVPAILSSLPDYIVAIAFLLGVQVLIQQVSIAVAPLPFLFEMIVVALFSICSLIIQARITGLTGRRVRERIAWG